MPGLFTSAGQLRVIAPKDTWTAVEIPVGARNPLLSMDDDTSSWRASSTNTLAASGEGTFVSAGGALEIEGTCAEATTLYVNPKKDTTCQVFFTGDPA